MVEIIVMMTNKLLKYFILLKVFDKDQDSFVSLKSPQLNSMAFCIMTP
jgi:hypothetical protein